MMTRLVDGLHLVKCSMKSVERLMVQCLFVLYIYDKIFYYFKFIYRKYFKKKFPKNIFTIKLIRETMTL